MKAVYDKNFQLKSDIQIQVDGDSHHHLCNVMRAIVGEEVLLLDGKGNKAISKIDSIDKKKMIVSVIRIDHSNDVRMIDLLIGQTKKEYLEDIVRQATELNVKNLYIVETEFSQRVEFKAERIEKIINSAMVQSNSAYCPNIIFLSINEVPFADYANHFVFHCDSIEEKKVGISGLNQLSHPVLISLGPEGGFSHRDIEVIKDLSPDAKFVHISACNILKTITAVPMAVGYVVSKL